MELPWQVDESASLFMVHKSIQCTVKILENFDPREHKMIAKWYKTVQFWHFKTTMMK